ncbi:hypothetical protein SS50377_22419 [Spironucleus salmonicida]|uniref:Uncharacterized protein n=1 Tax=Spironucleus salmonicida TaxID=348837 RepID=V6LMZ3_9EUKA|nr:hypothetical protein SS50377_22419 [Spironucleus salmonicida]|eukprot:EST42089.1 Hypothetical protein SS50377_18397 [Spironucleus salmonicida]
MEEIKQLILQEMKVRGIYQALQQKIAQNLESALCSASTTAPTSPSQDTLVLLEICGEFLRWLGLKSTAATLEAEAGISTASIRREFLVSQVGLKISACDSDLSILHCILLFCQQFGGVAPVEV